VSGWVVWLTGLPSSGKSTLALALAAELERRGTMPCVLDGDEVRGCLVPAPGYGDSDRDAFYATLANLAALLARQGRVVLVPATANRRSFRQRARSVAPRYLEVFVDVSPEICTSRDAKGLYAAASKGEVSSLPGADSAYEPPQAPDVVAQGGQDRDAIERTLTLLGVGATAALR
jgi:adenylylsulfate kinase